MEAVTTLVLAGELDAADAPWLAAILDSLLVQETVVTVETATTASPISGHQPQP